MRIRANARTLAHTHAHAHTTITSAVDGARRARRFTLHPSQEPTDCPPAGAAIALGAPAPNTLLALCGWDAHATDDIRASGNALVAALKESFNAALSAYAEYDAASAALMGGDTRRYRGKDMVRSQRR